jgi:hypothetical protein
VTRTCFLLDTKSPALLGSLHVACTRRLLAPVSIFRFVGCVGTADSAAIDRVGIVGQGLYSVVVGIRAKWWWNVRRIQYNCEGFCVLLVLGFVCFIGFGFWVSEKNEGSSCAEETSAHGDAGFSSDWRLGRSPGVCGFCELDLSIQL